MTTPSHPAGPSNDLEGPPYPSFKELRADRVPVLFSPAAKRLFWPLDGVFPNGISVIKTPRSADDVEPYFQAPGSGTWHEIAQQPLTEPEVSSVEASVRDLDQWESDWVAWHSCHQGDQFNPEYVRYGDLDDEDRPYAGEAKEDGSWEEDSDMKFLIKCCGQERPLRKRGQRLVVKPSAGHHFVTVHDYVSTAHPWLMSLRPDIFLAKLVARFEAWPTPTEIVWMVATVVGTQGLEHTLEERKSWIKRHGPPRATDATTAAFLERIRASKNR